VRAERYVAAIKLVRQLFSSGRAVGDGRHYEVDIDLGRPLLGPPLLYGDVAGPWVTRHVAPLVDRVEVLPFPQTSNTGELRPAEIANIDRDAIRGVIDAIKEHAPSTPVSLFLFIAVGTTEELAPYRPSFASPFASGLCGSAKVVAANLRNLADLGIDDVTLMPLTTRCERHSLTASSNRPRAPRHQAARDH
jgi:hypothetical protein